MAWRMGARRLLNGLILALTVWLLGASAYVTLGRLLVPAVADYREELVAQAEALLDRAISVKGLSGEMQGAQPVFFLRGLRVHASPDPDSPILLDLENVTARLDLFTSLWRRQPVLDALQLEGLALEVVEEADGQWALQGLGASGQFQPDVEALLDGLANLRRITLLDSQIRIRPQGLPSWDFTQGDLTLLNRARRHRLDVRAALPDGKALSLQIRLQRAADWRESDVEFYADLPPLQWSQWLPSEWLERLSLNELTAGGRYWGELAGGGLYGLRGEMSAPRVVVQTEGEPQIFEDLHGLLQLQLDGPRQSLQLENLSWRLGDRHWAPTRLLAERVTDSEASWRVAVDRLDLAWVGALLPDHLGESRTAEILRQLDLRGSLRDISIAGVGTEPAIDDLSFSARLDGVSLEPVEAVPGFSNISGSLSGTPARGSLRIDTHDWSMHLPRLFEHAWHYQRLLGELTWRWSVAEGLRLVAPGMRVEGEQGQGAARLDLHLPRAEDTATMALQVALRDSAAHYHNLYLPTRAPAFSEALAAWLGAAELDGRVPLAVFRYTGSIEREPAQGDRSIELYATLENGHLRYQPDWPALEGVFGTLRLRDQELSVEQASGRFWETRLEDVSLQVDRAAPGEPLRLTLTASHQGPLADALRIGQETPVAEQSANLFAGWRGEGSLIGELAMRLPLQPAAVPELDMQWQLQADELWIPLLQAPLSQVNGALAYRHGDGLQAEGLSLSFLGQPVGLHIDRDAGLQTLTATGTHPIAALRSWPLLDGVPLDLAEGSLDWQAQVELSAGTQVVSITSDLEQVELDLPGPLEKPTGLARPARLELSLKDDAQQWRFALGEDLQGRVEIRQGLLRGDLRYRDGTPQALPPSGLRVGARFLQFDLETWRSWYERAVPKAGETLEEGGPVPAMALQRVELQFDRFSGLGRELTDASLSAERLAEGWRIQVEQADIAGTLMLPDDDSVPWVVDLQRLRFERPTPEPAAALVEPLVEPLVPQDPLEGVRPSQLPALDVQVAQIIWGDDSVADARFRLRPHDSGALLEDVQINLRGGLNLAGQLDWREAAGRTQFDGSLSAGDIGEVLRAWQYAPTLTSSRFEAGVDLTWPGSPAFFALKRGTGEISLKARDGVVQSGEGSAEALRIFGLLNFNALTRRLRLDFSDIFGRGTAYDSLDTQLTLSDGVMHTRSPLVMDGPSARIELDGLIDLPQDRIDMGMLVTLPLTNNLPLAAILVGAPYLGGALFIADRILGDRISRIASVKYRVSGDWQQPTVDFDRAFDNKAALEE